MKTESKEIWKDVIGYEGLYHISNTGRVRSFLRKNEKTIKLNIDSNGYPIVSLTKNGKRKTRKRHQLVAEAFLSHIPCGFEKIINHINHIKTDNRVENLEITTTRRNLLHETKLTKKLPGSYYEKRLKKWRSSIQVKGVTTYLGLYDTPEEASKVYMIAVVQLETNGELDKKRYKSRRNFKIKRF